MPHSRDASTTFRRWRITLTIAITFGFLAGPGTPCVGAQDTSYLREMPTTERVLADYRTADPMETRARQVAALGRLYTILRDLAGRRASTGPFPDAAEKPIVTAWTTAANRIRNEGLATFPPGPASMDSPRSQWNLGILRREQDADFQDELMRRYFSPELQARHRAAVGDFRARAAVGRADIARGLRDLDPPPDTVWERMTPENRDRTIALGALMSLLLAVGALRELLPFRISTSGTPRLRFGFGRVRLDRVTGVVADYRTRERSVTTFWERTFPNGRVERSATTSTERHEEFDLVHASGRHHVHTTFRTAGEDVPHEIEPWVGRPLTVVHARRWWPGSSRHIMFFDPGQNAHIDVRSAHGNCRRLCAPRLWTLLPAIGLGYAVGSSTGMGLGPMVSGHLRGAAGAVLGIACWVALFIVVYELRKRRFYRDVMPRLEALATSPP